MDEKTIESNLKKAVVSRGGLCVKFVSPSFAGVPDRIVLLPGGQVAFVETKATGEKCDRCRNEESDSLRL